MYNGFRESEFLGERAVWRPSRSEVPHGWHEMGLGVGRSVVVLRRKDRSIGLVDCCQRCNLFLCEYFEAQSQIECMGEASLELTLAINSSFQELVKQLGFTRNILPVMCPKDIKRS